MQHNATSKTMNPWYKEPWAWLVAAPLIVVFIACSITVTIAVRGADDRVSDDYYKEGRMLSQEFTSDEFARSHGISADVNFLADASTLHIKLAQVKAHDGGAATQLRLFVSHPAEKSRDNTFVLKRMSHQLYGLQAPSAIEEFTFTGRWYLRLSAWSESHELWRLHGEIDFERQSSVVLQ